MKLGPTLNKLFGKAYIKNLLSSESRRLEMIKQCELINLDYEFTEAIDGKLHCDENYTLQHGPFFLTYPSSAGFLGVQMTAYNQLTHAIENNLEHAIFLDDDCRFDHTIDITEKFLRSIEDGLPEDWDIIILGDIDGESVINQNILYYKCTNHHEAAGSHGVAVNKKIFIELQSAYSSHEFLGDGVVGHFIDIGKNIYKLHPSICRQDRTIFSDINQIFHQN